MDKRNSFIQKGRDGKQKRSRSQKVVSIYRYPFSGVGCRIFPRDNDQRKRNCRPIIRPIVRDMVEGEKAESRQSQKGRSDMRQTITSLSSHRRRRLGVLEKFHSLLVHHLSRIYASLYSSLDPYRF